MRITKKRIAASTATTDNQRPKWITKGADFYEVEAIIAVGFDEEADRTDPDKIFYKVKWKISNQLRHGRNKTTLLEPSIYSRNVRWR